MSDTVSLEISKQAFVALLSHLFVRQVTGSFVNETGQMTGRSFSWPEGDTASTAQLVAGTGELQQAAVEALKKIVEAAPAPAPNNGADDKKPLPVRVKARKMT